MEGWHFLPGDRRLRHPLPDGSRPVVETAQTLRVQGPVTLCQRGLHASARALDALRYAPDGPRVVVCRVVLGGTIVRDSDKAVATERTCLWWADATEALRTFAIEDCAERALQRERAAGREPDPRSWAVLEVARRWLRGEATYKELIAARAAAWTARAAWGAAEAADWAARAAERDWQNTALEARLWALREGGTR